MPKVKLFDREEVLQKAMLLFWEKGYYHTSINDLINCLGISRSSLYDTFGGKKQLFYLVFEKYRQANAAMLRKFLASQKEVKKALHHLFEKLITSDCTDPKRKGCFIVNTTTELVPNDPKLKSIIANHQKEIEGIFFDFLSKGVASKQIPPSINLEVIAHLLYTLMSGIRVMGKTNTDTKLMMDTVHTVLSLLD